MKYFLNHEQKCELKAAKGCPDCRRIGALLSLHARSCREDNCKVPNCTLIRDHNRQMEARQQLMDDRRRAKMNKVYNNTSSVGAAEPDQ